MPFNLKRSHIIVLVIALLLVLWVLSGPAHKADTTERPLNPEETGFSVGYKVLSPEQITAYLTDVIQPKLESVEGVSQAQILGPSTYAMRIWLDTQKLNAMGVTVNDVTAALEKDNVQAAAGSTKGKEVSLSIQATTDLSSADQFKKIVVKDVKGRLVYLGDV